MDPTTTDLIKSIIAGQARHLATGVAGALLVKGVITPDEKSAFIEIGVSAALYLAGAGWSWWKNSGQAYIAAAFARLRSHVKAIPTPPEAGKPTTGAAISAMAAGIVQAKQVAAEPVK